MNPGFARTLPRESHHRALDMRACLTMAMVGLAAARLRPTLRIVGAAQMRPSRCNYSAPGDSPWAGSHTTRLRGIDAVGARVAWPAFGMRDDNASTCSFMRQS